MIKRFLLFLLLVFNFANISVAQSYFTVVDDDAASIEAITSVKKIADKRGIKVSFAICANQILNDNDKIKVLIELQNQGHHICNHSLTHSGAIWKNPKKDNIKDEIERSEEILDSIGFKHHNYLVYPFGKFSESVYTWMIPLVSSHFNMAFESRGYSNNIRKANRYSIARLPLRKHDNFTIIKNIIDNAIENGHWIVFLNHSGMNRDYSEKRLEEVIIYCQNKGMKCLTIHEAWKRGIILHSTTKPLVWTLFDEIIYFLYVHSGWLLLSGSAIIVIIFTIYLTKKFILPS